MNHLKMKNCSYVHVQNNIIAIVNMNTYVAIAFYDSYDCIDYSYYLPVSS